MWTKVKTVVTGDWTFSVLCSELTGERRGEQLDRCRGLRDWEQLPQTLNCLSSLHIGKQSTLRTSVQRDYEEPVQSVFGSKPDGASLSKLVKPSPCRCPCCDPDADVCSEDVIFEGSGSLVHKAVHLTELSSSRVNHCFCCHWCWPWVCCCQDGHHVIEIRVDCHPPNRAWHLAVALGLAASPIKVI